MLLLLLHHHWVHRLLHHVCICVKVECLLICTKSHWVGLHELLLLGWEAGGHLNRHLSPDTTSEACHEAIRLLLSLHIWVHHHLRLLLGHTHEATHHHWVLSAEGVGLELLHLRLLWWLGYRLLSHCLGRLCGLLIIEALEGIHLCLLLD